MLQNLIPGTESAVRAAFVHFYFHFPGKTFIKHLMWGSWSELVLFGFGVNAPMQYRFHSSFGVANLVENMILME